MLGGIVISSALAGILIPACTDVQVTGGYQYDDDDNDDDDDDGVRVDVDMDDGDDGGADDVGHAYDAMMMVIVNMTMIMMAQMMMMMMTIRVTSKEEEEDNEHTLDHCGIDDDDCFLENWYSVRERLSIHNHETVSPQLCLFLNEVHVQPGSGDLERKSGYKQDHHTLSQRNILPSAPEPPHPAKQQELRMHRHQVRREEVFVETEGSHVLCMHTYIYIYTYVHRHTYI